MPRLQTEDWQLSGLERPEQHAGRLARLHADALGIAGMFAQAIDQIVRPGLHLAFESDAAVAAQHAHTRLRQGDV
jgi:hypothetical protein